MMSVQRVLKRLSPLMVMVDREHIPSFKSTLSPSGTVKSKSWTEILAPVSLVTLNAQILENKRVVVFGEQHHEPQVLRAQMSMLNSLHQIAKQESGAEKRVVMVMEHFNFQQDDLLQRFSEGSISNDELLREYALSKEGFSLNHYLPLLLLARELNIPIYGGFPPRPWASTVFKESIAALRNSEAGKVIPTTFGEARWGQVSGISDEQVAYLNSMLSNAAPVLPDSTGIPEEGYLQGILPAQTLKDTFFAWAIDQHIAEPNTIVYAVCGLGHSEFDLCVSSRLQQCTRAEILLVASKSWLSEEYIGDDQRPSNEYMLADLIIPYEAIS